MKDYKKIKYLNSLLAFGMLSIFVGFLLVVGFAGKSGIVALSLWPLFLFFCGLIFLFCFIAFSRTAFKLFLSILLILSGIFCFFVTQEIIPFSMKEWWPILVIFVGIALCSCCFLNSKRVSFGYFISSFFMIFLGIAFLFYSFSVIKISLSELVVKIFPVMLIISGFFLIGLYFQRKLLVKMLPDDTKDKILEEYEKDDLQDDDL